MSPNCSILNPRSIKLKFSLNKNVLWTGSEAKEAVILALVVKERCWGLWMNWFVLVRMAWVHCCLQGWTAPVLQVLSLSKNRAHQNCGWVWSAAHTLGCNATVSTCLKSRCWLKFWQICLPSCSSQRGERLCDKPDWSLYCWLRSTFHGVV